MNFITANQSINICYYILYYFILFIRHIQPFRHEYFQGIFLDETEKRSAPDQFLSLCKWLFSLLEVNFDIRENTSTIDKMTQLCINMQNIGISRELISSISPASLCKGYGDSVVTVLYYILEQCLYKQNVKYIYIIIIIKFYCFNM